ncbi:hypothetical protein DFA_10461 [Cavenderia fasciculata]|uniref:Uncharacterized protein n=1 Tax=Cavenderia fasciculata TaxID=261658 RepID=F4QAA0_CACFS|nr:uncharacterized protein DFA_10461 [Cavenderia fasciculata]EGG15619.1 hypothetical protein DFA_10461 [Cavenderia fasciculata]|eukprot:XP_004354361.1 hypothetical protein DFA_10461 [Cavenderia fasciculata]
MTINNTNNNTTTTTTTTTNGNKDEPISIKNVFNRILCTCQCGQPVSIQNLSHIVGCAIQSTEGMPYTLPITFTIDEKEKDEANHKYFIPKSFYPIVDDMFQTIYKKDLEEKEDEEDEDDEKKDKVDENEAEVEERHPKKYKQQKKEKRIKKNKWDRNNKQWEYN